MWDTKDGLSRQGPGSTIAPSGGVAGNERRGMHLRNKLFGRYASRGLAVIAACVTLGMVLVGASSAQADSTAFSENASCINFQVGQHVPNNTGYPLLQGLLDDTAPTVSGGTLMQFQRPVQVYDYRGTANLYWAPYVRLVNNATGVFAQRLITRSRAYPWRYVWRVSNGWFTNLWWNQQSPYQKMQYFVPPGWTMYIWSATYWLNRSGRSFHSELHYLGRCSG